MADLDSLHIRRCFMLTDRQNKFLIKMIDELDLMALKKAYEQAETNKELKENLEKFIEELQKRQKEVISDNEFKI